MSDNYLQQPVTKEYLGEYTDKVILPGVEKMIDKVDKKIDNLESRFDNLESRFDNLESRFDNLEGKFDGLKDEMVVWKDEMLTSNDKLSGKLDTILTEQAAHTKSYEDLDQRMEKVEDFAVQAASKLNLEFERA